MGSGTTILLKEVHFGPLQSFQRYLSPQTSSRPTVHADVRDVPSVHYDGVVILIIIIDNAGTNTARVND